MSIPVGVGVNLLTPWLKNVYSAKSSVRRNRRIQQIINRYTLIQKWRLDRESNSLLANFQILVTYTVALFSLAILGGVLAAIIAIRKHE